MLNTVNTWSDAGRFLFMLLDYPIYFLLSTVYQIFFNVINSNLIDGEIIYNLFSRVQLIIGIFMMFQLAMTILKGIVNPDSFTDSKTGFGNVIMRIIVSLTMLALIVPLNITNPRNEYEKQINNNGVLFGTLYSLQYRVLENNTLGRLIFGNDDDNYTAINTNNSRLVVASNKFAATVIKSFYVLNRDSSGNFVCSSGNYENIYNSEDTTAIEIASLATEKCGNNYVVTMLPVISTIAGGVLLVLLFLMTFDMAVRVVKLSALQLMAPIPIISYMDPKGSKDGAFNAWVKLLISTYIDLFIRLAVIYFAMDVIELIIREIPDIVGTASGGSDVNFFVKSITVVILFIAIIIFAKQAPKFFKQMLGIKDNGGKFFSAFGEAMGVGAIGAGAVSGAISGVASGKGVGGKILGGLGGFAGGGFNAGKTFFTDKDANGKKVMAANRAYAQKRYANAADESTFRGRLLAAAQSDLGFQNKYDKMKQKIAEYKAGGTAYDNMMSVLDGDKTTTRTSLTGTDGKVHNSIKDLNDYLARLKSSGGSVADITAAEDAIQAAKAERIEDISSMTPTALKSASVKDRQVRQYLETMYDAASKHKNDKDEVFKNLNVASLADMGADYGNIKGAFNGAKDQAKLDETSGEYKQAEANARRAQDSQKKS